MDPISPEVDQDRRVSHVGDLLRSTRERLGEPISKIASVLRIRPMYLEDIEAGRYGSLPGGAYAVGFVRAYADYLGLHSEEVVRRFKDESQKLTAASTLDFPVPTSDGGMPRGALIIGALFLAACTYGGWYWLSTSNRSVSEIIPDIPERLSSLMSGTSTPTASVPDGTRSGDMAPPAGPDDVVDVAPPPSQSQEENQAAGVGLLPSSSGLGDAPILAPGTEIVLGEVIRVPELPLPSVVIDPVPEKAIPAPGKPVRTVETSALPAAAPAVVPPQAVPASPPGVPGPASSVPDPASRAALRQVATPSAPSTSAAAPVPAPVAPPASTPAPVPAAPSAPVAKPASAEPRIVLRASRDSWIELRQNNTLVTKKFMRTGDVYLIPNDDNITLTASNAGGLEVYVDGSRVPALGPPGVARDTIAMDPERLKRSNP